MCISINNNVLEKWNFDRPTRKSVSVFAINGWSRWMVIIKITLWLSVTQIRNARSAFLKDLQLSFSRTPALRLSDNHTRVLRFQCACPRWFIVSLVSIFLNESHVTDWSGWVAITVRHSRRRLLTPESWLVSYCHQTLGCDLRGSTKTLNNLAKSPSRYSGSVQYITSRVRVDRVWHETPFKPN